jgi:crotonobetaine/carnitine-CoA ligase
MASVFQAVAAAAAQFPERPALTGLGRHWTYHQLIEDVERLAQTLADSGCRRDTTIAVVSGNNPLMALVWLAAARAGTIVSLVNFMFQAEELGRLLTNLQPKIVFCDGARLEVCKDALKRAGLDAECVVLEDANTGPERTFAKMLAPTRYQGAHPTLHDPHEISYTSGTTSAPKGAVLTHEAVLHRGGQEVSLFKLTHEDAALIITPLFHQSGIRDSVLVMLMVGGHAVITPKFDAATFWAQVKQYRITYCCMVETILLFLERQPPSEDEKGNTLRRVLGNGDPEMLKRLEARFDVRFVTVYGMTENGVPVAVPMDMDRDEIEKLRYWRKGAFLAGWPQTGVEVRLVHEGAVVAGEGSTGEIQIRSKNLLKEYYRAPEATQETFTDGWFKTGDMGLYGPKGSLYFLDRIRDVIRRGGENIASKEVEGVINAHPDVKNVAVIPVPDPMFQQEVKAVVVPRDGAEISVADLWTWCDGRLARYKVPRYIEFRDTLPVSGTGRIQKQTLRAEGVAGLGTTHDRRQDAARS